LKTVGQMNSHSIKVSRMAEYIVISFSVLWAMVELCEPNKWTF